MRWEIVIAIVVATSSAARANDKLQIAPPAAWVRPIEAPKDDGKASEAALKILLQDQQVDFERDGTTAYYEMTMRVQTPQGLAAGNISLPWNPETDTLTVHKVRIIRSGQVIDVLASQSFTILRRETNLENAVLDGVLTANIQPQGLQVGDIIDFSASVRRADPAIVGHGEQLLAESAGLPVERARMIARWPNGMHMRWRESDDLPAFKITREDGFTTAELTADGLKPAILPKGAPQRFAIVRQAEFTDLASWANLSALIEPLFAKAAALAPQSALRQEVARIAATSSDPKHRAEAALALVQNQVRYVYLGINDGGLTPASADTTWSRRFGDCKGKTVLLLALLRALDIQADPVVVSAGGGDGIDRRLPMIALFDHVVLRTVIGGKTYWLDGTRLGDTRLDNLEVPAFHWGLPLVARDATLVQVMPSPFEKPAVTTTVKLDASAGIDKPAPAHVEILYRADLAIFTNLRLANLAAEDRDRFLREFWRGQYAFIDPKAVSARYDAAANEELLVLDGSAKMDWSAGGYETDGTLIGYLADFTREPSPHADAPFAVGYPSYSVNRETIVLPDAGRGFRLDSMELDRTVAGVAYHRHGSISNGVATVELEARAVQPEFPASEAAANQEALRTLSRTLIDVHPPEVRTASVPAAAPNTVRGWLDQGVQFGARNALSDAAAAFDSAIALDPRSVEALVDRGELHLMRNEIEPGSADFDKAASIDPQSAAALAGRGWVRLMKNSLDPALTEFNASLQIDPLQARALFGRGEIEEEKREDKAALIDLTMALQGEPKNGRAYFARATVLRRMGRTERAIADVSRAIALWPGNPEAYVLAANLYEGMGKPDQALAQAAAVAAAGPDNAYAHTVAGVIYAHFHRTEDAMGEFSRSLAIEPTETAYLNRADAWPHDDLARRAADVAAAKKLAPDSVFVAREEIRLAEQRKDYPVAIAGWTTILKGKPDDAEALNLRGIDYARSGEAALAARDFAAARAHATDPQTLNNLCYSKAMAGQALATALDECDAAVAGNATSANILDSRGFVLLRMARYQEAITTYSKALTINPKLADSLYGRSLAEAHLHLQSQATADKAAATALKPTVTETFAESGVIG